MKYIKTYDKLFESTPLLKEDLTIEQLDYLNIYSENEEWEINKLTGLIDIKRSFRMSHGTQKDFLGIKFGKVGGDFRCSRNKIESLEGAPQEVGGDFNCEMNSLTTLEGAPQEVGGGFYCDFFKTPEWSILWAAENSKEYPILNTVVSLEILQDEINKEPGKMVIKIKQIWKKLKQNPDYASLKFPGAYKKDIGLTSDLSDLGF